MLYVFGINLLASSLLNFLKCLYSLSFNVFNLIRSFYSVPLPFPPPPRLGSSRCPRTRPPPQVFAGTRAVAAVYDSLQCCCSPRVAAAAFDIIAADAIALAAFTLLSTACCTCFCCALSLLDCIRLRMGLYLPIKLDLWHLHYAAH